MTAIRLNKNTIDTDSLVAHLERISASTPDVPLPVGLEPISRAGALKRIYKFVMYCVPTYSNPTGETWDLETRRKVVEIARKWDMLVISDDVYDFLGNDGDTSALAPDKKLLPRLVTLDHEIGQEHGMGEGEAGYTISNCSFSKLLGPGLRCGWMESATGVLVKQISEGGANRSVCLTLHTTPFHLPQPQTDNDITRAAYPHTLLQILSIPFSLAAQLTVRSRT